MGWGNFTEHMKLLFLTEHSLGKHQKGALLPPSHHTAQQCILKENPYLILSYIRGSLEVKFFLKYRESGGIHQCHSLEIKE